MLNAALDEWQRQVIHLRHAWRCYNQKVDDEGECQEPMTLETTINDLIEQNTKLGRERAAAVNHFTCIMALAPAIFRWKKKLQKFWSYSAQARDNMSKLDGYVARVQQYLLLTPEILENHGYNVINVEEGNHEEIKKRNKCFSALREFMTTLTETQAGGGQSGTQVAASGWKKVLKFGDNVWPPEPPRGQIPEWVAIQDPTVPAPRVNRFGPRPPPGPPPGFKAPPQPYIHQRSHHRRHDQLLLRHHHNNQVRRGHSHQVQLGLHHKLHLNRRQSRCRRGATCPRLSTSHHRNH